MATLKTKRAATTHACEIDRVDAHVELVPPHASVRQDAPGQKPFEVPPFTPGPVYDFSNIMFCHVGVISKLF